MLNDTTAEALAVQVRVLRRMGSAGRAAMTFELCDNLRSLVAAGVRHRHPHWDARAIEREVIRPTIGDELFRQARNCVNAGTLSQEKTIIHPPSSIVNLKSRFIVLDGPDGCGKSSQARMLMDWLGSRAVTVAGFRDPGGTGIGEKVREILLSPAHEAMATPTEVLLYMAARAQLWAEGIGPALEKGKCVVLDRWLSSTCAYQGYAGGFGVERVVSIARDALERVWPDLTIILDVDLPTAARRLKRELDRMERKGGDYHARVREGFLRLADGRRDFAVVNAADGLEAVHKEVVRIVQEKLEANR
jgi:dTMP kinase